MNKQFKNVQTTYLNMGSIKYPKRMVNREGGLLYGTGSLK
jgi:hypothetical protein